MYMSENPEKNYHLPVGPGDVGRYAFLPGDPGRVEAIAHCLDEPEFVVSNREYTIWNGKLCGETVTVCSTGIGGPSAAIAMEELFVSGTDTFLRVGTCGGIQLDVLAGDIVIATGAVRMEGTSREYAPIEFPAVADFEVTAALKEAAGKLGIPHHLGIVQCKDSFYGQHSPEKSAVSYELQAKWEAWKRLGVKASEMESAALFTVASLKRVRCGADFFVVNNQERIAAGLPNEVLHDTSPAIKVAVEAMKILIEKDRKGTK